MIIRFVGDIHLGKRFPYTTNASSPRFEGLRYDILRQVLMKDSPAFIVMLGDLFDGFNVSSRVLVEGYSIVNRNTPKVIVLAGNHDKSNNTDEPSSLQLLDDPLDSARIVWEEPEILRFTEGSDTLIVLVPHQLTQEKFENALLQAKAMSKAHASSTKILCLHCNWGDREGAPTENYLRTDMATELLTEFTKIISGHEHNRHAPKKGVEMLGSIMPFSFGEMTDKWLLDYDTNLQEFTFQKIWPVKEFSQRTYETMTAAGVTQFMEISGEVTVDQAAAVNRKIAEWHKDQHGLIAVKNSTRLIKHEVVISNDQEAEKVHWTDRARAEMSDQQIGLFNQVLENLQ